MQEDREVRSLDELGEKRHEIAGFLRFEGEERRCIEYHRRIRSRFVQVFRDFRLLIALIFALLQRIEQSLARLLELATVGNEDAVVAIAAKQCRPHLEELQAKLDAGILNGAHRRRRQLEFVQVLSRRG